LWAHRGRSQRELRGCDAAGSSAVGHKPDILPGQPGSFFEKLSQLVSWPFAKAHEGRKKKMNDPEVNKN
jgi:hypothetical protein